MGRDIFEDPRIRSVGWRDLRPVTGAEIFRELLLPASWLAASLTIAAGGRYVLALGFSFMFFLTGLRIVHNAFHAALGLSRRTTNCVLWIMSILMLGSMHAVRFNHLRHHRLKSGEGDVEARSAEMPAWRALLFGPVFPDSPAYHRIPAWRQETARDDGSGTPVEHLVLRDCIRPIRTAACFGTI